MENYLKDAFLLITNMSITATYVAIIVLIARIPLRKLPKIFSYSLWGILLFRLLSPISFTSAFSFLNFLKPNINETGSIAYIPKDIEMMQSPMVDVGMNQINNVVNTSLPKASEIASMNPMQMIIIVLTFIWIIGIIGLIGYAIISYFKVNSRVKTATICKDDLVAEAINKVGLKRNIKVYITDQIESPFVFGIFNPKIYISANIERKELPYILIHEFVHIKRFDYVIKPFSYLLLILHWFNPMIWVSFNAMNKDMEMACDEKVMELLGEDIREDYSNSLLSLAVKRSHLAGSPLAFGESNVKSRIKNVLRFKKTSFYVGVTIVLLISLLGITLLANPLNQQNGNAQDLNYERIYEYKTPYVGNASNVSNLTNYLYYSEFKNGISLKTDARPYEVTVNYTQLPDGGSWIEDKEGFMVIEDHLYKNAAIMFALISNVDKINFTYMEDGELYTIPVERTFFDKRFGEDIRGYSASYDKFREAFIPRLEEQEWLKSQGQGIHKTLDQFYLTMDPENHGELRIYDVVDFKGNYLILAEKYRGEGQASVDLFLINKNRQIVARASGEKPISMAFSVNKLDYDSNTILFGTLNNKKWDPKQDKKVQVQIKQLDIGFSNKHSIKEDVSNKIGYIVYSSPVSEVEYFNLYNDKNEIQSSLSELGKVSEVEFKDISK